MKKANLFIVALLSLSFLAGEAHADCYRNLSNDFKDSQSFQISNIDVSEGFVEAPKNNALQAVRQLANRLGCEKSELKLDDVKSSISCRDVAPGISVSKVCYVESDLGYFLVSKDMLENMNIIFNRWD